MLFRARHFEFSFPGPVLIMGIVNVTPDSFSDGGKYLDWQAAVDHALALASEGANILDIGGESSRPGSKPVDEAEEIRRVIGVIKELVPQVSVPISIDTTKPAVAQAALAAGASIVNNVAARYQASSMAKLIAASGAGYICMHSQGLPLTMQDAPYYENILQEVTHFFSEQLAGLSAAGVSPEQVVFDPGIGFGKSASHNLQLLANLASLAKSGRPLLLGISRKSFLADYSTADPNERLPASLACATLAVASGVNILRVHDVAATVQAVRVTAAVMAQKKHVV